MLAVFKRELRSYFTSMTGYVFIAAGTAFIGFYFMYVNMANGYPYFSYSLTQAFSAFALITPVITMKSFAEERKNKTDQLLLTYPVKISSIVLGKFFAMLLVFAIPFLISCACPLIIEITGDAHLLSDYVNIFIMILMGSAIVSIGMFVSSQTENQIIAAVVTLVVCLLIFWWDDVISYLPAEAPINAVMIFALIILASVILRNVSGDLFFSLCFGIIASIILAFLYLTPICHLKDLSQAFFPHFLLPQS